MTKTAKLFINGGSQAVRLPADFRFDSTDEVYVRRDQVTGDVVLSAKPPSSTWSGFFALRDSLGVVEEFLADRPLNELVRPRERLAAP
jgi:antitoxin VapB